MYVKMIMCRCCPLLFSVASFVPVNEGRRRERCAGVDRCATSRVGTRKLRATSMDFDLDGALLVISYTSFLVAVMSCQSSIRHHLILVTLWLQLSPFNNVWLQTACSAYHAMLMLVKHALRASVDSNATHHSNILRTDNCNTVSD